MILNKRLQNGQRVRITCQGLTVEGTATQVECYATAPGAYDLIGVHVWTDTGKVHYWKPDIDDGTLEVVEIDPVLAVIKAARCGAWNAPDACGVPDNLLDALEAAYEDGKIAVLASTPAGKVSMGFYEIGAYDGKAYQLEGFSELYVDQDGRVLLGVGDVDDLPDESE